MSDRIEWAMKPPCCQAYASRRPVTRAIFTPAQSRSINRRPVPGVKDNYCTVKKSGSCDTFVGH